MIPAPNTQLEQFTRLRPTGSRHDAGRWVAGPDDELVMFGSIQPDDTDDYPTEGGRQYRQQLKVYVAPLALGAAGGLVETEPSLRAGDEDVGPDRVRLGDGRVFVVDSSMSWSSHVEAVLLREP